MIKIFYDESTLKIKAIGDEHINMSFPFVKSEIEYKCFDGLVLQKIDGVVSLVDEPEFVIDNNIQNFTEVTPVVILEDIDDIVEDLS